MNLIKERILQFIKYKGLSNKKFCEELDIRESNFSSIGLKSAIGSDNLFKILYKYSELSPDWLILGNGDMIRNNNCHSEEMELLRENRELRKEIDFLRMKVENLEKSKKLKNNHDSVCQM